MPYPIWRTFEVVAAVLAGMVGSWWYSHTESFDASDITTPTGVINSFDEVSTPIERIISGGVSYRTNLIHIVMPVVSTIFSRLWMMQKQLLFSIVYFFFCTYVNSISQVLAQRIADSTYANLNKFTLPDLGFKLLPHLDSTFKHSDMLLLLMELVSIVRLFLESGEMMQIPGAKGVQKNTSSRSKNIAIILRRILFIHGTCFLLRALSICITILPNPHPHCVPMIHPNIFVAGLMIVFGSNGTCYDVFFSGHAAAMMILSLFWQKYTHDRPLQIVMWIMSSVGWLVLIATRFHYTVDVLYGCLIGFCMWQFYHTILIHKIDAKVEVAFWWPCIRGFMEWFESDRAELQVGGLTKKGLAKTVSNTSRLVQRMYKTD
ncbi:Sgms2 [Acrasis kona]|uniref:Sgms2 n=1 Tax=Acrasis kona TaxID=1008807 RepID=A0AAW2YHX9_9EUKA